MTALPKRPPRVALGSPPPSTPPASADEAAVQRRPVSPAGARAALLCASVLFVAFVRHRSASPLSCRFGRGRGDEVCPKRASTLFQPALLPPQCFVAHAIPAGQARRTKLPSTRWCWCCCSARFLRLLLLFFSFHRSSTLVSAHRSLLNHHPPTLFRFTGSLPFLSRPGCRLSFCHQSHSAGFAWLLPFSNFWTVDF